MYWAYLLNPPMVFRVFWNVIKPFVDPVTKEKMVFCSGTSGMAKLLDAAQDKHMLEDVAGGVNTVKDFDSKEYMNLPFDVSFDEE